MIWRTQNGRSGCEIVNVDEFPTKGTLISLGRSSGLDIFKIDKGDNWIIPVSGQAEAVAGCSIAYVKSLQGNNWITIIIANTGAIWKEYGYKCRYSNFYTINKNGNKEITPTSILVILGIVKPDDNSIVNIPEPPPIDGNLQNALRKAGII